MVWRGVDGMLVGMPNVSTLFQLPSLLVAGGKTRKTAGPRSEGESYWLLSEAAGWFGNPTVRARTFTEVRGIERTWSGGVSHQIGI